MDAPATKAVINLLNETVSEEIEATLIWAKDYKLECESTDMSVETLACLVYIHGVIKRSHFQVGELLEKLVQCSNIREMGTPLDNYIACYDFPIQVMYHVVNKWKSDNHVPALFNLRSIAHSRYMLHHATFRGDLGMVQWLIESGVIIDATDSTGRTALHVAAVTGNKDVLLFLLSKGSSIYNRDRSGHTPFELALDAEQFETAGLLNPQMFCNMWYGDGESIVFKMIRRQKEKQLKYLLGLECITRRNSHEETLLHVAVHVGNVTILDDVIQRCCKDPNLINAEDDRNRTPLAVAVHRRNLMSCQMLIAAGAEVTDSIIQYALTTENIPFLELIGKRPSKPAEL